MLGAALIATAATPAAADPAPSMALHARVVWSRGDRVYLAALDSTAIVPGARLTLLDRAKVVATAEVTAVYRGEMLAARVTSGTLSRVKRPERLSVRWEPAALAPVSTLRLGYPGASRVNPLFRCAGAAPGPSLSNGRYRFVDSTATSWRLVRRTNAGEPAPVTGSGREPPWPDTLVLRFFDDVADEEIALERGEIDGGLFWPGEASSHIRDAMGWEGGPAGPAGPPARGFVTAAVTGSAASDSLPGDTGIRDALIALNRDLFRGDLAPLAPLLDGGARPGDAPAESTRLPDHAIRFEVDAACPGRLAMERLLNRRRAAESPSPSSRVLRLRYVAGAVERSPAGLPVFAVRCPLIWAPGFRTRLGAIDDGAIDALVECRAEGGP
ncbi:MAG TPA: hypothetical protein VF363_03190 [Candidatus Eisenbacteria bacterium]